MPTLVAFTGFEFGRPEGIGTGTAGNRVFDGITGTAGTDVKVSAGTRTGGAGNYVGEINLTAKNFFWDTNTIGAAKTVLVVSMYFRLTTLPSGSTDIISMDVAAATDRAGFFYNSATGKLHAWIAAVTQASVATINVNQWYKLQWRYDCTGTNTLDWTLDGVAGTQVSGSASSTVSRIAFGNRSAGTGVAQYDDVAISVTSGDHPLTAYKVPPVLVPDTGGTAVEIGTANATARFVTNSTVDATFNSANILAATSEVPPTIGATASGVAQRTSGATNAVGLPMTSYTLTGGETIDGTRIIVCGWAASALANNYGVRAFNGTAETILIGDVVSAFTNSTTVPDWACKLYSGLTDQTTINALVVRLGYSTDISPTPGAHAVYAELAIAPAAGTSATVTPAAVQAVGAVPAPAVSAGTTLAPAAVAGVAAVPAVTVTAVTRASPAAVTGTAAVPAPAFATGATVVPAAVAGVASVPAPTLAAGSKVTATAVQAVAAVPAPTLAAGSRVGATAVQAVAAVPAPTLAAGATLAPAAVAAVAAVPAPAVAAGAALAPASVAGLAAVPAPTVAAGSTVTAAAVHAVASVPAPSVTAGGAATVVATAVQGVAAVPAPGLTTGSAVTPAAVTAVAAVPALVVTSGAAVVPAAVQGVAAVPAPAVSATGGASIAPAAVQGVAAVPSPVVQAEGSPAPVPAPLVVHTTGMPVPHVADRLPVRYVGAPVFVHLGTPVLVHIGSG